MRWLFGTNRKTAPKSSVPKPSHLSGAGAEGATVVLSQQINIALQHHQAGRLSEAEAAYREILAVDPENIDALHFSGVIAYQRGENEQAAEWISRALARNASNAPAHNNLGNVLVRQGKLEEAIACYRKALALQPDYVDAHINLGAAFRARGELDEAVACYQRALSLAPDIPTIHSNLGNLLSDRGKPEEAIARYRKALALKPDFAEAHSNLGSVLTDQGRVDEAIACHRRALALKPDFYVAHNNLGDALFASGRPKEAEESYLRALRLKPDFASAKVSCGLVKLLLGDYENGLSLFESRFEENALPRVYDGLRARLAELRDAPRWHGEDVTDKSVLVWTDQGLGDSLMLMRYLPLLKRRGIRKLMIYCEPALVRVVEALAEVDQVVPRNCQVPFGEFDCHCPLTSLPFLLETRLETIPGDVPYLFVPDGMKREWARKLAGIEPPRVGLVWAGRKDFRGLELRSISLEQLSPLFGLGGANFVSLQKGEAANEIQKTGWKILNWMDECDDMLDTAALIEQLDLIISIDTAVAHLAGALSKPVWLLLRFDSDWRWMLEREYSPWYPTTRLFRQRAPGDWHDVVARMAAAFSAAISESKGSSKRAGSFLPGS